MFDKEAIEALQYGGGIKEASEAAILAAGDHSRANVVSLPNHFEIHDLERYLPNRRRARGIMATSSLASFTSYTKANEEHGTAVFISADSMTATAVLNLGCPDVPGHADNRAKLEPKATAAYKALLQIANGQALKQIEVAEFLEDWPDLIQCFNADGPIKTPSAIASVRKITIEALRKLESEEQSLSASRSAFESVAATSKEPLPTLIYFKCQPYADLAERTFIMRLGVLTGNDKPAVTLRVIKAEEHTQEMAEELAAKIVQAFDDGGIPVMLGVYQPGN